MNEVSRVIFVCTPAQAAAFAPRCRLICILDPAAGAAYWPAQRALTPADLLRRDLLAVCDDGGAPRPAVC